MTTTSSIAFPTMDVPIADDSMEMASPLPGHDDFEIDLDVMEDQASNADKDMMGADDYPTGDEIDVDYQRDANDADMIDDVAEPTMVDADDQYPNDNEMQYATEELYEAEMEDEYAEDSDVPMPKVNEEDPVVDLEDGEKTPKAEGAASVEPAQTNGVVGQMPESEPSALEPVAVESKSEDVTQDAEVPQTNLPEDKHDRPESEKVAEDDGLDQQKPEQAEHESHSDVQEGQELGESHVAKADAGEADQQAVKQAEEQGETAETQPSVDHSEAQVSGSSEEKEAHVTQNEEPRSGLHPVKVYYQDNEISLFPPREGDASETYFLGDESLAYESFGKLFESFRSILQDHISDNDILVIDIDSMNIQLTEDSMHLSQVTLHQIINLYLHLCDNESIGEPETLYLSLSTKLTIPALLSDIQAAANDGKGLSEIFWDDYDEAVQTDDQAEGQPDDKSEQDVSANLAEPQVQGSEEAKDPEEHHDHEEHEPELEHEHVHEHSNEGPASSSVEAPQAEQQEAPEEHKELEAGETQQEEEPEATAAAEEEEVGQDSPEQHDESQQDQSREVNFDAPEQDASYEQEEEGEAPAGENISSTEHGEEDTAGAAAATGEHEDGGEEFEEGEEEEYADEFQQYDEPENEEQEQAQEGVEQSYDPEEQKTESTATLTPLPAQDATDNQPEAEKSANVTQAEETNPEAPEDSGNVDDDLEFHATDDVDADVDGYEEEQAPQEPGLANEDAQDDEEDTGEDPTSHQDAAAGEASKEDLNGILHEQTESTAEAGVPDVAEEHDQGTTAENHPAEIPGEDNNDHNNDHGVQDGEENLDEFLDIDFDAEFGTAEEETGVSEAVVGEPLSTKRSREPEDETDPTDETSTPDVKRTRSS